jgi:hypothetical protein
MDFGEDMFWRCISRLLWPSAEDKRVLEALKSLPPCARVTAKGGFYRGPYCTKDKCICGKVKRIE